MLAEARALEDALAGRKRPRDDSGGAAGGGGGARGGGGKRRRKDEMFGTGYKGRRSKSNDGRSAADMSSYRGPGAAKGKHQKRKTKRPGKEARARAKK